MVAVRERARASGAVLIPLGRLTAPPPAETASGKRIRRDALPENTPYADTGCDIHPSCLTCPLVRCRYDEPGGARKILSEGRDRDIVALSRGGSLSIAEIAQTFAISRRTVFRVLARSKVEERLAESPPRPGTPVPTRRSHPGPGATP